MIEYSASASDVGKYLDVSNVMQMDVQSAQMASPVAQENAYLSEDSDQDSQLEI